MYTINISYTLNLCSYVKYIQLKINWENLNPHWTHKNTKNQN